MNIRFIHIEKCGGTSVSQFLRDNNVEFLLGKNSKRNKQHSPASVFEHEKSFKFTIVRNPYERLVSFFHYEKNINCTWEIFVREKLDYHHLTPQVMKIYKQFNESRFTESQTIREREQMFDWNTCLVDKIFKLEDLQELKDFFQISSDVPHLNKCLYDRSISYYTTDLQEIVYNYYKKDFELLGYEK